MRSIFIVIYFLVPPTPASTLLFAAIMGILWLGIAPVVTGFITQIFGLKYVATLTGIAFFLPSNWIIYRGLGSRFNR